MTAILDPKTVEHDGSHLTREQVAVIEDYVRQVLLALDLNYWRVYVAKDLPGERIRLSIEPTDGRRVAMLFVSHGWIDGDPEEMRTDITHECLHLAHHDLDEGLRRFVDDQCDVGRYPMALVWEQAKVEIERMVDSLSYVLAPHMPPWPTSAAKKPKKRTA